MLIGYARVSTAEQNIALQLDSLRAAGCEKIYRDVASGVKSERIGLKEALGSARDGDTLVVWKLDRFGRSLKHLIEAVGELGARGVGFRSLHEQLDTTSSAGKLLFHVLGALAEFERDLIRERTEAGLKAARARGRKGGRPRALDEKKVDVLRRLYEEQHPVGVIGELLGVSRATVYRSLGGRSSGEKGRKGSG